MQKLHLVTATAAFAVSALALAGCQSTSAPETGDAVAIATPSQSEVTSATPTPSPTPTALAPLTIESLMSAPVPESCEHPAGVLVDGDLPGIAADEGHVSLAATAYATGGATTDGGYAAFNPTPAPGEVAAVAVISCSRGGVSWPDLLVAYDHDVQIVESFDALDITSGARDGFTQLVWNADDSVSLVWKTNHYSEAGCCGTLTSDELLTFDADGVSLTVPAIADALAFTDRYWGYIEDEDWASVDALSATSEVSSALTSNPKAVQLMTGDTDGDGAPNRELPSVTCIAADDPMPPNYLAQELASRDAAFACTKWPWTDSDSWLSPTIFLVAGDAEGEYLVDDLIIYWN